MQTTTQCPPADGRRVPRQALIGLMLLAPGLACAQALGDAIAGSAGLAAWLNGAVLAMGLVLTVLSRLHRRERGLLLLGLLMGLWALHAALGLMEDAPAPVLVLRAALLALQLLCLLRYLFGQLGWQRAWLNWALWLQVLVLPLSHALAETARLELLGQAWGGLLAAQALAALAWQLWLRRRDPQRRANDAAARHDWVVMLMLGAAAVAALGLEIGARAGDWLGGQPLWALTVPLLLIGLGLHAVQISTRARDAAEAELLALEDRQQEHLAAMERSFAEMAEQKLEQVTERERKRIAADLHDDLGAKLLTIVHTSESDRISTLAREALEEMRLSVRGLTGKPVHLLDALGDWRAEVVSRLGQANILAEWKSPAEEITQTLPARAYVQTTRILRESVSNIIKHSGATHCTVSCAVHEGDFQVIIQDNGQGISTDVDGRLDKGHGMASMKARAKQMHGQCLVESGPGWGTVIRLTIPL